MLIKNKKIIIFHEHGGFSLMLFSVIVHTQRLLFLVKWIFAFYVNVNKADLNFRLCVYHPW